MRTELVICQSNLKNCQFRDVQTYKMYVHQCPNTVEQECVNTGWVQSQQKAVYYPSNIQESTC
jgi:hypothetical protein